MIDFFAVFPFVAALIIHYQFPKHILITKLAQLVKPLFCKVLFTNFTDSINSKHSPEISDKPSLFRTPWWNFVVKRSSLHVINAHINASIII